MKRTDSVTHTAVIGNLCETGRSKCTFTLYKCTISLNVTAYKKEKRISLKL